MPASSARGLVGSQCETVLCARVANVEGDALSHNSTVNSGLMLPIFGVTSAGLKP